VRENQIQVFAVVAALVAIAAFTPSAFAVPPGDERTMKATEADWYDVGDVATGLPAFPQAAASSPAKQAAPANPSNASAPSPKAAAPEADPFADIVLPSPAKPTLEPVPRSWNQKVFTENFAFRKEIMSQFDTNDQGKTASRQSLGFEVQKKFSTATSTFASFDFQGRFVRRDGFNSVLNDLDGVRRPDWKGEYHNLYLDLYNVLNPVLNDEQRGENVGRFNTRTGRFYVPFGINLQTDTHGTVLQLSNEQNYGFERDWYTGFWGSINKHVNYDIYYLVGSGYDLKFKGQSGLGATRISLGNKYSYEYGLEGGFSVLGGERLVPTAPSPVETKRVGLDGRYRHVVPTGSLTVTSELSGGRDFSNNVLTQLYQAEYLHSSRQWGVATQYRRFQQEAHGANASVIGELSWYFRNDIGNSNLHWLKFNIDYQSERMQGPRNTIYTLQYYFYQ
jgi:hypothetical protein